MNKSTHPVDLNVCDLTPLSLPSLLLSKGVCHNGSVDTPIYMCVCLEGLVGGVRVGTSFSFCFLLIE